jgi:hypothetical protein
MYLDTIIIVLVTFFATLAATECGLTLKKAFAPIKLLFRGFANLFNSKKDEPSNERIIDEQKEKRARPRDL